MQLFESSFLFEAPVGLVFGGRMELILGGSFGFCFVCFAFSLGGKKEGGC